jgi:AraC-like DNA-binding protein
MICRSVLPCASLGQALDRMLRFFGLILDDISARLEFNGRDASVVFYDSNPASRIFGHEVLIMLIYGLCCWLIGRRIEITHAKFGYREPAYSAEYRLMYCERLSFDEARTAIIFDADHLKLPIVQSERTLKDFLRTAPEGILVKYKNSLSFSARLRRRLRKRVGTQFVPFQILAKELHIGAATLRRRLHDEGTSYQAIKDRLKLELALTQLRQSDRDILSIGIELGYSERSAFHRAFAKWTGIAPAEYRRRFGTAQVP